LPIDAPIIFDAIFAFRLQTYHLKVLHAIHGRSHCMALL
jgi:hypothetical protein